MLPCYQNYKAPNASLQSRWLTIHVGTAIISYGSFAAAGLSLMYLINERNKDKEKKSSHLPDAEVCDYLSYRVIAFGYLMLTLVIITELFGQKLSQILGLGSKKLGP